MSKRFIIGLIAGIAITAILFALQPGQVTFYYGAVLEGSAVASAIAGRFVAGFLAPVYVVGWKVTGLIFIFTGTFRTRRTGAGLPRSWPVAQA